MQPTWIEQALICKTSFCNPRGLNRSYLRPNVAQHRSYLTPNWWMAGCNSKTGSEQMGSTHSVSFFLRKITLFVIPCGWQWWLASGSMEAVRQQPSTDMNDSSRRGETTTTNMNDETVRKCQWWNCHKMPMDDDNRTNSFSSRSNSRQFFFKIQQPNRPMRLGTYYAQPMTASRRILSQNAKPTATATAKPQQQWRTTAAYHLPANHCHISNEATAATTAVVVSQL